MSNEKMREEFEAWIKSDIGVDCEAMPYGQFDGDIEPQYHNESDPDGALIVSSMLAAWQASRAALCVELPRCWNDEQRDYRDDIVKYLDSSGVSHQ